MKTVHTHTPYSLKIRFTIIIILSPTHGSCKLSPPSRSSAKIFLWISHVSHSFYISCQYYPPWLNDYRFDIWWRVRRTKLLSLPPTQCHVSSLLTILLYKHPKSICSSLRVRDQVPHPYKKRCFLCLWCCSLKHDSTASCPLLSSSRA
jgi:hypothetical protein